MDRFLSVLPKVELHAHLNGSLRTSSIRELGAAVHGAHSADFLELARQFTDATDFEQVFKKFRFMHSLTATRRGLQLATELAIRDFALDNVMYLELRTTPKANAHMTRREYLEAVLGAIEAARGTYAGLRVQLLPSIDRSQSVADAEDTLNAVLALKAVHPQPVIAGLDLSGYPDKGCFSDFRPVLERARQNGLALALHCAESDNPQEIGEMLEFGMARCGHGTFLTDDQLKALAQRNVAVECCLSSNVMCGSVPTFGSHHFGRIFRDAATRHLAVVCTDDCGVFDTTLTAELAIAARTFDLGNQDIVAVTLNAVEHSFAGEAEKRAMRQRLEAFAAEAGVLL